MLRSALACFVLFVVTPAWGQSWCANHGLNPTEQTVCATPDLAARDQRLEQAYQVVRHLDGVQSEQRDWIAARDGCGWNVDCIRAAYDSRIAELEWLGGSGAGAYGGKFPPQPAPPQPAPVPQPANYPPWCYEGPHNAAEQTICSYPDLGQMDIYMADLYAQVRHYPGVQSGQRHWLTARNACHADYACLQAAYSGRISYLETIRGGH